MQIDVVTDVTDAVALGETLRTRATVTLPEPDLLTERPVVCFAFPGGGYSRRYFTLDLSGGSGEGQAGWHARRGWIFVSCDHLSVGESDSPRDPAMLAFEHLAAANAATVEHVSRRLVEGSLTPDLPALEAPLRLGIGQSMGGCLVIVQQGQHGTFDGIAVLGYSARHTVGAMPPGTVRRRGGYVPRGSARPTRVVEPVTEVTPLVRPDGLPLSTWGFHDDDEDAALVAADMDDYPRRRGGVPPWGSATIPPCAMQMMSPGAVAPEAAVITVPVLVAVGERDVCPDPLGEPSAYQNARDVTVFICPRMAHMHNFARTRELLWARIDAWGETVRTSVPGPGDRQLTPSREGRNDR